MGNSESSNPIRNMDKRTARREYRDDFAAAITRYRQRTGYDLGLTKGKQKQSNSGSGSSGGVNLSGHPINPGDAPPLSSLSLEQWGNGEIRVFSRKRPIFQHEIENGEFDVITCYPKTNKIVVHDARMHNDMKRQLMHHHEFEFDHIFSEYTTNDHVYQTCTRPLVDIACRGGFSTAMVYGQTGSGKTFTMTSIYKQASIDIFQYLNHYYDSTHTHGRFQSNPPTVSVAFMEIAGDNVNDLLNGFHPTQLRASADGTVHPYPITECKVTNADDLMNVIQHGLNIRTTAATGVHDQSSRSHAILKIFIQRHDLHGAQAQAALQAVGIEPGTTSSSNMNNVEGTLTLVDLAGSEHRIDSMYHGKERRKETSYINASLMALKECIRSRAKGISGNNSGQLSQHVYRKSKLTMALKGSFFLPYAKTIVIATVSPASKDTEHSLNTLRHACIMNGQTGPDGNEIMPGANAVSQIYTGNHSNPQQSYVTGGNVTTEQIGEINVALISKRNSQLKKQNGGQLEDLKTSNGNSLESSKARQANKEIELTEKMKLKLRRMSEAKSFNTLEPHIKEILKMSRSQLGRDNRQMGRIQSNGSLSILMMQQDAMNAANAINYEDGMIEEGDDEYGGEEGIGGREKDVDGDGQQRYEDDYNDDFGGQQQGNEDDEIVEEEPIVQQQHTSNRKSPVSARQGISVSVPQKQQANTTRPQQQQYYGEDDGVEDEVEDNFHSSLKDDEYEQQQRQSSSNLVPYQSIYDSIFIARDSVPLEILFMQLRAMLRVHHYTDQEIEYRINSEKQKHQIPLQTRSIGNKLITSAKIVHHNTISSQQPTTTTATSATAVAPVYQPKSTEKQSQPKFNRVSMSLKPDTGNTSEGRLSISRSASASDVHQSRNTTTTTSTSMNEHQNIRAMVDSAAKELSKLQHDLTIEIPPKKTISATTSDGPVIHSARRSSTPRRGEGSSMTSTTPRRGDNAAAAAQQQQQALLLARQKVEEEARQRKARQDAAKAFREEQDLKKKSSVGQRSTTPTNGGANRQLRRSPASKAVSSSNVNDDSFTPQTNINHMSIDEHSEEINRLTVMMDSGISGGEEMSSAMKYSVKKQIQLHRAAILKAQRMAKANNGETNSVSPYEDSGVGGGVGGGGGSGSDKPRRVTGAERYGAKVAPPVVNDGEEYGIVSAHGRPLNKQLAKQVLERNQGAIPLYNEESGVEGRVRHSREGGVRPSTEIDLRFDRDQEDRFSYQQHPPQPSQSNIRSNFVEGREDFPIQVPQRSQSRGRSVGGSSYASDDRSISSRGSYSSNTNSNMNNAPTAASAAKGRNIYY